MVKLVVLYFLLSGEPALFVSIQGPLSECEKALMLTPARIEHDGRKFVAGACVPVGNFKSYHKKKKRPPIKYKHSYAPINPEWLRYHNVPTKIF